MDAATPAELPSASIPSQDAEAQVEGAVPTESTVILDKDEEGNKFHKAIAAWRNINLTELIPTLDTTASDLVAQQRDSLVERKDLAQKTKDFRKLEDQAKLTEIKSLLKAYQTYIDHVTTHSKTVSSAFLQVYSPLSEAPDPYPLLEASVDSLVVADETLPKLEAENKNLQSSTSKLSSQIEDLERQLEQERNSRSQAEESRADRIKEVESSWSAVLAEKEDNWASREKALEERADNQERLVKELKANYEVSQRLEKGDDSEPQGGASAAELEIVTSDLERANTRLAEVESRNEQLRVQLAQSTTQSDSTQRQGPVEDDPTYLRLRSENSSLLRKVDAAKLERDSEKRSWENDMRSLKRDFSAIKDDCSALRAKVQKWSDYEDVQRELEVLKSIEFATGDNDALTATDDQEKDAPTKQTGENLEQLLMARNKKLNNELTVLRVSHQDLASRLELLQDDLSNTNMELERSRNLAATLENDLTRVQQEASSSNPAVSVAGTYTSRYPGSSHPRRGGRVSPTSSIISGFDTQQSSLGTLDALRAGEPVGGGSGILPMITAQRDRFKKRISELEAELSKNYGTVSSLRNEVASLQKDNLNLYEKTRYVSSFRGQPSSSSSTFAPNPNPSTIQMSNDNAPLDRYQNAYETKISPFAAFRGRESARVFKKMSLPERGVLQITRMVLATRTSRNLFALYCVALHLLVLGMLYYATSASVDQQMVRLADQSGSLAGAGIVAANDARLNARDASSSLG